MRAERQTKIAADRTATGNDRRPVPFIDEFGNRCFRVPLDRRGRNYAVIEQATYRRIVRDVGTGSWYLNSNGQGSSYVRCNSLVSAKGDPTVVQIARLATGAGRGTVIRYANGNSLDLRASNLTRRRGSAKRRDIQIAKLAEIEVAR